MGKSSPSWKRIVVKNDIFDRGDIIWVSLNPVVGRELQGERRPGLVLSKSNYNALGSALVAPISQGGNISRFAGFTVALLGSGTKTQGVVLANAVRMLDLENRHASKIEVAPAFIIEEVLAKFMTILE